MRGLVLSAATTSATAEEIVSAAVRVVLAAGEVPATVATTSPADAGFVSDVHRLVLTAETIVLRAAAMPANLAKALKTKENLSKRMDCSVLFTNS
jgi:hypothetical protein